MYVYCVWDFLMTVSPNPERAVSAIAYAEIAYAKLRHDALAPDIHAGLTDDRRPGWAGQAARAGRDRRARLAQPHQTRKFHQVVR